MGLAMDIKNDNIYEFFSNSSQYRIPIYQRQYSWQKSPQCEELWKDLVALMTSNQDAELQHFFGTVVGVQISDVNSGYDTYDIIDGQQRLTTLTLVLIALRFYLKERKALSLDTEPQAQQEIQELEDDICGMLLNTGFEGYDPKLVLTRNDQQVLLKLLQEKIAPNASKATLPQEVSESLIFKNCAFFTKKFRELFQGKKSGEQGQLEFCASVFKPVFQRLVFANICLDHSAGDNPQQIFESLNSTGMGLSQTDLIRNFLLMDMSQQQQHDLYERYWLVMETAFDQAAAAAQKQKNKKKQNKLPPLDLFMLYFLTSQMRSIPKENQIYMRFKEWYQKKVESDASFSGAKCFDLLYKASMAWCLLYWGVDDSQEQDVDVSLSLEKLRTLDRDVVYPAFFQVVFDFRQGRIDKEILCKSLDLIASYVLRVTFCADASNLLRQFFNDLSQALRKCEEASAYVATIVDNLCSSREKSKTKKSVDFPSDQEFKNALLNYKFESGNLAKYMLLNIERWKNKEPVRSSDEYDHVYILPLPKQSKIGSLDVKDGWGHDVASISGKTEWAARLGNISLCAASCSAKIKSAKSFTKRRDLLQTSYRRHLNDEHINKEQWTAADIKKRGEYLCDIALYVWPYPQPDLFA